jgi:hypothetical protein
MRPQCRLILAALLAPWAGCGLMLGDLAGGSADDAGDTATDPDGGAESCPGYEGNDTYCCVLDDPCFWAADGLCDCEGTCDWDIPDCGAPPEPCPGYEGKEADCCLLDNPCGWASDGYCDCDGTCDWDEADCDAQTDGGADLATGSGRT